MKKLTLLILLVLLVSCSETDDGTDSPLPAITSEGKNTFGCKINGETFLPRNNGGFSAGYTTVLSAKYAYYEREYYGLEPGYHLAIDAYNSLTNKSIRIELSASDSPLIVGETYPITLKENGDISAEYSFSTSTKDPDNPGVYIHNSINYITTNEYNGEITFNEIDENNRIISGVFNFKCVDTEYNETTFIKDGRFDIIYDPYF